MAKTLRVIQPFLVMDTGDTFELDTTNNMYIAEHVEEFHKSDDSDSELRSVYQSNFAISVDYARELITDGYLEEITDGSKAKPFTNVFDEIDLLTNKYSYELSHLAEDMAEMPECVKVERTTVLNNILSVLEHLKGLKK